MRYIIWRILKTEPGCDWKNAIDSYLHGSGLRVVADQEHFHGAIFLHGQWQGEVAERVKSDWHFGALWADQRGLEQAMEDIHNDGIVT